VHFTGDERLRFSQGIAGGEAGASEDVWLTKMRAPRYVGPSVAEKMESKESLQAESSTTSKTLQYTTGPIRGTIIEAEIKQVVDPTRPLPLATAVYAIEAEDGFWLCSYYGSNRSNFDYLPQKGAVVEESKLGLVFHSKEFISKDQYQPERWDEFKRSHIPSAHKPH
jgi:hypothetical protein